MCRIAILVLLLGTFAGCAKTAVRSDADSALWGRSVELDGTEYFRIGKLSVMTRDGESR